jgi:hypothetical protein
MFLVDDDLVGPFREGNLLDELQRLRVEDVDRPLLLVRTVVIEPVGVHRQVVGMRTSPDEANHLVDGRIDDVMDVAGVVALKDANRHARIRIESRHALCRDRRRQHDDANKNAHAGVKEGRRHVLASVKKRASGRLGAEGYHVGDGGAGGRTLETSRPHARVTRNLSLDTLRRGG